ncbi:unnamed protein product [Mytilus coruscus]|uniref:Ig-like domain-containing protein n=1 Tax=Mytilus coruscus TaxID=42192 RepID=A0A6J8ALE1_MYTCO|nr:unnamed protein product [Mytilus coruscus]
MKSTVLVYLCWTWFYVHMVCVGTTPAVNFISESPGTTIILKYNYAATTVDWTGPNHENKGFHLDVKDMYGIRRSWNVTLYTSNGHLNKKLPHATRLQIVGNEKGQFYLQIKNISLYDAGLYICDIVMNNSVAIETFIIQIKHSPEVTFVYDNYTESDRYRHIQCNANGYPRNYTYEQWEHKSFFDEHIRYLTGNATGYLRLPTQTRQFRYQDSGVYLCSVSNGVSDSSGQFFQKGRAYVISKGSPIFVEDNKYKQYGNEGHHFEIKVNVFSFSNITCQHISSIRGMRIQLLVMINRVNMWADFNGRNIKVLGWEVVFRFSKLNENDFKEYAISVCNEFGNSSFILELLKEDNENTVTVSNSLIGVLISSILITLIVVVMIKYIVEARKRHANFTPEDASDEPVEGQSEAIENVLYQSRQQENHNNLEISPASTLLPNDANSEHAISEHETMTYNNEETGHSLDVHLNYADVVFQPSSSQDEVRIIGLENRTVYADVDTAGFSRSIPDIQSDTSSSEDDFVYVQGIENYIEKRETNG